MTTEAILSGLVELIADAVAERIAKRAGSSVNAKALTRRQAEKAMGIGRSKLQELIADGAIKTVKDNPRLVPASEVERYCQPRRQKPRRAYRPPAAPQAGITDGETTRQRLGELIRKGKT